MLYIRIAFVSCLLMNVCSPYSLQAQIPVLNRSFESGTLGVRPPAPWLTWSSPDHLPGNWQVDFSAKDGRFYIGMVVRTDGTNETTYQAIDVPPNQDFNLYFWLASTSDDYGGSGGSRAKLNVWLSEDFPLNSGSYQKLISQSHATRLDSWELQIANFSVEQPTNYLVLESEFFRSGDFRRGNILVDNLGMIREGELDLDLGADTTFCEGDSLNISFANPDVSLRWLKGNPENPSVLKEEGVYVAELSYHDLLIIDSIRIRVVPYPNLHLPPDTSICLGDTWELQLASPPDAERYLWSDGGDSPTRLISESGTYILSAWNGDCKSEDEIVVETFVCDDFLEMPNVFSPNGDGINDEFKAIRFQNTLHPQWSIFDRWGRTIFEGQNLSQGWNGTWQGKQASLGTYYWVIQYVDPRGGTHIQKGNLLLLR